MICERCRVHHGKLFAIYKGGSSLSGTEVCGNCLVGEFVPVFRSSLRRWSFGQVLVFRSDGQFCLMFGTSGTDREWVDVQPKPFDAYVAYYRTGATTSTKGPPIPHVIHEPGYDDTPIPLESSGIIGQRSLVYGFPIPLTPIQIPPHAKPVAFQSYWSVPYYQRDFVTPNRSNSDHHQAADEGRLLLKAQLQGRPPSRWPEIAEDVPNRTGKQCRDERYVNHHLKLPLNRSQWSPVEDAQLFLLHSRIGPKWATIAGLLRGRDNNNAKNRFHHIRRQLKKDASKLDPKSLASESPVKLDLLKRLSKCVSTDELEPTMDVINVLVGSILKKKTLVAVPHGFKFELDGVSTDTGCSRCGLLVPSRQTGDKRCRQTGWCESCVSAPAYLCSDLLRVAQSELGVSKNPTNGGPSDGTVPLNMKATSVAMV